MSSKNTRLTFTEYVEKTLKANFLWSLEKKAVTNSRAEGTVRQKTESTIAALVISGMTYPYWLHALVTTCKNTNMTRTPPGREHTSYVLFRGR